MEEKEAVVVEVVPKEEEVKGKDDGVPRASRGLKRKITHTSVTQPTDFGPTMDGLWAMLQHRSEVDIQYDTGFQSYGWQKKLKRDRTLDGECKR